MLSAGVWGIPVGGEMACGRVVAIPVAVVAIASDAIGDDCTTIVAGSHAVDAVSVPIGRIDVNGGVSVEETDAAGWVAVTESVRLPAPPVEKLSPSEVGVAVTPVSVITAWVPADVGTTIPVLLSDAVVPPSIMLRVGVGALPGPDVIIIELEGPPVGTAE